MILIFVKMVAGKQRLIPSCSAMGVLSAFDFKGLTGLVGRSTRWNYHLCNEHRSKPRPRSSLTVHGERRSFRSANTRNDAVSSSLLLFPASRKYRLLRLPAVSAADTKTDGQYGFHLITFVDRLLPRGESSEILKIIFHNVKRWRGVSRCHSRLVLILVFSRRLIE